MAIATDHIDIPILADMKAEVLEVSDNKVRAKMPFTSNRNHVGTMYAGSLFTLAEFPAGVLFVRRVDPTKIAPLVAEMKIRYRRPATSDIYIDFEITEEDLNRMETETLAEGKSTLISEQELKDEKGEVVAIAEARYVWLKV